MSTIEQQNDPRPGAPSVGDLVVDPVTVDPTPEPASVRGDAEPHGGDALREQLGVDPVVTARPLPRFSPNPGTQALPRQVPNSPFIDRPVSAASDNHHAGVPSASSATQPGSAAIRDLKPHGGKF
jgi:hypothetical protein